MPVQGCIKSILATTDGKFNIGLGWPDWRLPEEFGRKKRRKSDQFLAPGGVSTVYQDTVCQDMQPQDDETALVQLWDGAVFQVHRERLLTQLTQQRKAQLQSMGKVLNVLNALYGLEQPASEPELIEAILDFEFRELPETVLD